MSKDEHKLNILTEDGLGYYELNPVDTTEEVKEIVRALMRDWRAWAKRMKNNDIEALRHCGGAIMICVYEIEKTFKIKFKEN